MPAYDLSLFPSRVSVVNTTEVTGPRGGVAVVPGTPSAPLLCYVEPHGPEPAGLTPAGTPATTLAVTRATLFFPADPGVHKGGALLGLGDWAGRTLVALGPGLADGPGLWKVETEEKR